MKKTFLRGFAASVLMLSAMWPAAAQPVTPTAATVEVNQFVVEGMKTLDPSQAEAALAPYKGRPLTFAELEAAAQAVAELYRANDYFTVSAYLPKQELNNGTVTIKVVESTLGDIAVEGNKRYSDNYIKWMLEPVAKDANGGLPRRSVLQRQLLLLNDNMDLDAKSIVRAGDNQESVDLLVQVEDDLPTHFTVDYNNLGARFTGRNRLGGTFEWGNFTDRADVLSLRYVDSDLLNADVQGVDLFNLNYTTPLNNKGTQLSFGYANSAFQVGRELQILDIRGDADVLSLMVEHPLIRDTDANLYVSGGFVYQDINNTILGTQLSEDRLREVVLGVRGDWNSGNGRNFGGARVTQDLGNVLGGLSPNDPLTSRQSGGGFTKLNLDLARVQRFSDEFYGILRGSHQAAFAPLPYAEQYGLGGISTVRGYVQSAYLADSGYNVNAEMRWAPIKSDRELFQFGVFLDHGAAYLKRPFPGEINNTSLTGAGFGLHFRLPEETYIRAEVGFPLGNNEVTDPDDNDPVPYLIFSKRF